MIGDITAEKVSFWLFFLLCYRKWLMLFSLKFQRDNRKNALAVDPAEGKTGKRLYFHRTVEMKQPHTITEPCLIAAR